MLKLLAEQEALEQSWLMAGRIRIPCQTRRRQELIAGPPVRLQETVLCLVELDVEQLQISCSTAELEAVKA